MNDKQYYDMVKKLRTPKHYTQGIDCWKYISSHNLNFNEGNIIKYVTRYKLKDGLRDLLKAQNYLNELIREVKKNDKKQI